MELNRYSATEPLRDGRSIEIRALRPGDRDELLAAVDHLSDESIYRRFFAPKRHFSDREIDYYTKLDFVNHVGLVAVLADQGTPAIVGGARYVVTEPGTAELAFTVDDAHQGLGIGSLLMKHLVVIARHAGLKKLVAEVLAGNAGMLKVLEKSGLHASSKRERETLHINLDLS